MSLTLPMLHDRGRVNIVEPGRLHPAVSFSRASTATYMGSGGTLLTAAINAPRYEYDSIGNYLGLLIEEARTNALLNSATLVTQIVTVTAAARTLSFYGTGTVTLSGTFSGSLVGTGASNRVTLTFTPTAGTLTLTISGSCTNAQLETGAFATSYIPTTGAAVTRSADIAQVNTLSSIGLNLLSGTLYAEIDILNGTATGGLSQGIAGTAAGGTGRIAYFGAGVLTQLISVGVTYPGAISTATPYKIASTWGPAGNSIVRSGGIPGSISNHALTGTALVIGAYAPSGVGPLDGHIKRMSYYPAQIPVIDLSRMTA
jgi:hypothetical protein